MLAGENDDTLAVGLDAISKSDYCNRYQFDAPAPELSYSSGSLDDGDTSSCSSQEQVEKLADDQTYEDVEELTTPETNGTFPLWRLCLGTVAFLDVVSVNMGQKGLKVEEDTLSTSQFGKNAIQWFTDNAESISVLFSLLWIVEALLHANRVRKRDMQERERKLVLEAKSESQLPKQALKDDALRGAWKSYFRTVLIDLLLLPLGFYFFCYQAIKQDPSHHEEQSASNGLLEDVYKLFANSPKLSFFSATCKFIFIRSPIPFERLRKFIVNEVLSTIFGEFRDGILHPVRFKRRFSKVLRWLKWAQYLAPIIPIFPKLLGNTADLIVKYKQRLAAKKAMYVRKILWRIKTPEERRMAAIIKIQSSYRSRKARKVRRALDLMSGKSEVFAALKLQSKFRRKLEHARAVIEKKRAELKKLQVKKNSLILSQKKRLYELQEELSEEAKALFNRRLLLRPNTRFAVIWKMLFVACVIFEITLLSVYPELRKLGTEEMQRRVLYKALVPNPASQLPVCSKIDSYRNPFLEFLAESFSPKAYNSQTCDSNTCSADLLYGNVLTVENKGEMYTSRRKNSAIQRFLRKVKSKVKGDASSKPRIKRVPRPKDDVKPWYCSSTYFSIQEKYIKFAPYLIRFILFLIASVVFMDVFITFFTGELCPTHGALIPKSFFTRWIAPGLVLQMGLNPQMETTSKFLTRCIAVTYSVGPERIWRWFVCLFYPLIRFTVNRMWLRFVKFENKHTNTVLTAS